jgi:hypothetical protein
MLSGVTMQVGETEETFRLTTRAMMAAEDHLGKGIMAIVQELNDDARVGTIVRLLAEAANDGAGVDLAKAQAMADALGIVGASELLGQVVEKAFPEASGSEAPGKNRKGAGRSK